MESVVVDQTGAARALEGALLGGQGRDDEYSLARCERDELPVGKLIHENVC
jgi:hypothetical protein